MKAFAVLVAIALLALPAAADAKVRRVSLSSSVQAGERAQLIIVVTPRSRCSISLTGVPARTGGRITWTWQIPLSAKPGSLPFSVSCGKAGRFTARITIRPAIDSPLLGEARVAVCNQVVKRVAQMYGVQQVTRAEAFYAGRSDAAKIVAKQRLLAQADCVFLVRGIIDDVLWYYVKVVPSGQGCGFAVSTRLSSPNNMAIPSRPLPDETYLARCTELGLG
jgi:hypothetical protein